MADNQEVVTEYLDFLDDELRENLYHRRVQHLIDENGQRLLVCIDDLRNYLPRRCAQLLYNFIEEEVAFKKALKIFVTKLNENYGNKYEVFFVGFYGAFGGNHVTPRTLRCKFIGRLVCLEGVVSRMSNVENVLVKSVHYCPATKQMHEHRHADYTSPNYAFTANTSSIRYPTRDDDGNLLETEFGLSVFKDRQTVTIQESVDKIPAGLARYVDVLVEDDLVDTFKSGDRIMIVGAYRSFLPPTGSIFFETNVVANNIIVKNANFSVDKTDITLCRNLVAEKKDTIFDLLADSIAPSVYGHAPVKKAIVCLLLGGVETTLPNKTRLRGNINMLLIGDTSVAKSQFLR
ncbi:DNA replication licensing factor Mcm3-like [Metopolophium dirhodum]|uniref:DNA replication licensing factor Mcm3-like n=1 Tax=Metopolophium dirhodum TaxID=44670 RepID=UPI00298FC62D|nr:DNA replication licensing factor Mcm3-like [Metopolophium dirhodum]